MAVHARPFASEADYAQMRNLLIDGFAISDPPVYGAVGYTVGDLDWWRWTANPGEGVQNAHLWFEGEDLVALAWPGVGQVDLVVHPNHRDAEPLLLKWMEDQPLARSVDKQGRSGIRTWSFDGDRERIEMLRRAGYQRTEEAFCFRERTLADDIPAPVLPGGFYIRTVMGEQDLERRVDVHRDAFAPSKMTVEKHRKVMRSATYRRDLDLVVEAPDGSFAAYCLVWFDEQNRFGIFEPVGCHSSYRQRGLTKAVMFEGMRRLCQLGATRAFVNSRLGAAAPSALYESVGMHVLDESHAWVKAVE